MRKGTKADSRLPLNRLFFDAAWEKPLEITEENEELLEMVRWAPSAVNKQPWRIIFSDGKWHFYEKKDKGMVGAAIGDLQKIDLGIGLCHFIEGLKEKGMSPVTEINDPQIAVPENVEYIASVYAAAC